MINVSEIAPDVYRISVFVKEFIMSSAYRRRNLLSAIIASFSRSPEILDYPQAS